MKSMSFQMNPLQKNIFFIFVAFASWSLPIIGAGLTDSVKFYLYNNKEDYSLNAGRLLKADNPANLKSSGLSPIKQLKILIHGFGYNFTCMFPQQTKDVYFERQAPADILIVDWGLIAQPSGNYKLNYLPTLLKSHVVADQVSKMILNLRKLDLIDLSMTHIVGFSIGAHIAGQVGQEVAKRYPEKIARITALDPSGPGFDMPLFIVQGRRLERTDARFIDVVHTDMASRFGSILGNDFGTRKKLGHLDFFINGGRPPMPSCVNEVDKATCSHYAAPNYFMQSIGSIDAIGCRCTYRGFRLGACDDLRTCETAIFGDNAQPGIPGNFYLKIPHLMPKSSKYNC